MPDTTFDGNTIYEGQLEINHAEGVIIFTAKTGPMILRITHLRKPVPRGAAIDLASVSQLTSFTPLEVDEAEAETVAQPENDFDEGITYDRCTTCGKVHDGSDRDVFKEWRGVYTLYPGHEYLITTQKKQQRHARIWRMGYLGRQYPGSYMLQFSARGPDRKDSGQYGGTVTIDARDIVEVKEVQCDEAKRHVERRKMT
jgi:hypothetical protein